MTEKGRQGTLVLLRHGESEWNNEEKNLFCGWVDVALSSRGLAEAHDAAKSLTTAFSTFDIAFTSFLKRAQITLDIIVDELHLQNIHVEKSWRLNERHYGALTGLNKHDAVEKFGLRQVEIWRRSFDVPPEPLSRDSPFHPCHEAKYAGVVPPNELPSTESLKDVIARFTPYFEAEIRPRLLQGQTVLIVAHGSVVRCIVKLLNHMSDSEIEKFDVPTAMPYVFEFDAQLNVLKSYFLADDAKVKEGQEKIRNQILASKR